MMHAMSLLHFFLPEQILEQQTTRQFALDLLPEDVKHLKVARIARGEHIAVIDADQNYFECEIVSSDNQKPLVRICQKINATHHMPSVVLAQGLAKGNKFDDVVRHATELGVSGFVPLECERSVVKLDEHKKQKRVERWNALAKSAAMQSGQIRIPYVNKPLSVSQFCFEAHAFDAIFVCWEQANESQHLFDAVASVASRVSDLSQLQIAVVIGPEGGLSEQEILLFQQLSHLYVVSLGSSILRTETAGILAPALVLYTLGELGGCSINRVISAEHS